MSPLTTADISWSDVGNPISTPYDDVYFNTVDGITESKYIFLEGNDLKEQLIAFAGSDKKQFVIGETGFGTGLNFLITLQLWQQLNTQYPQLRNKNLVYTSVEKFPLTKPDLIRAHKLFDGQDLDCLALQTQYPSLTPGKHVLFFENCALHLSLGDACDVFEQMTFAMDVWFLDGFNPGKNPDMWTFELFQHIGRLSHKQTTLATFTVARIVRDGLKGQGFKLAKRNGFGMKREMLTATYQGITGPLAPKKNKIYPKKNQHTLANETKNQAATNTAATNTATTNTAVKNIAIVGAGIAGSSTAFELTKRGYKVTVFDEATKPATKASGNRQGALYFKPASTLNFNNRFYLASYLYALNQSIQQSLKLVPTGLAQVAFSEKEQKKQNAVAQSNLYPQDLQEQVDAQSLSDFCGITINQGGIWQANSGWVQPAGQCEFWLKGSHLALGEKVLSLQHNQNQWQLTTSKQQYQFDAIVIANAFSAKQLLDDVFLPLKNIRGQISHIPSNKNSEQLKAVVCTEGYATPAMNGQHLIGATFTLHHQLNCTLKEDHQKNILQQQTQLPGFTDLMGQVDVDQLQGKTGFRCTTPDYLPVVGPVSLQSEFAEQFKNLFQPSKPQSIKTASCLPNLYLNVGHGSKGLCSSGICAHTIAALINDEPLPLEQDLYEHIHPNRFLARALKRGQL